MDVSNNSLLQRLVASLEREDVTKAALKNALKKMGVTSVFDIVRMSKAQFSHEFGSPGDIAAGQIYDIALSHARQISRLYQEHRISPASNKLRNKRSLEARPTSVSIGYQALFEENWDQFCSAGDIAAIDSPVAYLRALYLFASTLESLPTQPGRIKLEQRRPDLRKLTLDRQHTFVTRPMLKIVNEILLDDIKQHLADTDKGKTVPQVLAGAHYPFSLPYDLHHHQCLLGLGTGKPALGELNYRISLVVPFSVDRKRYGRVSVDSAEALKLLSGLSPEQQALLIAPIASMDNLSALKNSYGMNDIDNLTELECFKERSGLTTEQVDQLLAQGNFCPRTSANSPASIRNNYGASYINGVRAYPALAITTNAKQRVFNSSRPEQFDRLQRMIRLHRWTGIAIAELDTLITNAQHSEKVDTLNANTLRALGAYRYLNRRHGIAPEEFASFLHDMPTHASGDRVPLFDQVFNRTQLLKSPDWDIPNKSLSASDELAFSYLSAGLGLPVTPDSLLLLTKQASQHISLRYDLRTVSALYRQARIARMFGLSPLECTELARSLGGNDFCEVLVTGELKAVDSKEPDILDVLMAMDWAVDWLRQNNQDILRWCRQFKVGRNNLPLHQNLQKRLAKFEADTNTSHDSQHLVEDLLHDIAGLPAEYVPCVLQMAFTDAATIIAATKQTPNAMPPELERVLRTAQACHRLHLSSSTLNVLMENPTWLAPHLSRILTPYALYLLECFSYCARHQAQPEENLLHCLQVANQEMEHPEKANELLAELLDWNVEEVRSLTALLPLKRATSMEAVDWIMRCKACCRSTGLSANLLLKATTLSTESPRSDWKTVGEALIAACH
jgi:hypothetical protein